MAALAGLGALVAVPLTVQAADSASGLTGGDPIVVTKDTPAVVKTALKSDGPVVVAFLLPGMTEDEIVQKRLNSLSKSGKFSDTKFLVFRITGKTKLGDLPDMLGIKATPAVSVFQGDEKLSNTWRGLVDEDLIAQSIRDARAAVPQAIAIPARTGKATGNAAAIALAKKVNAHYAKVPGVTQKLSGSFAGLPGVTGTVQMRLAAGIPTKGSGQVTVGGKTVEMILNRTGFYAKAQGATCWTRDASKRTVSALNDPAIPFQGVEFGKPVTKGTTTTITAKDVTKQYGGGTTTYTVNAKTFELIMATKGTQKFEFASLPKAPAVPKPDKVC